MTTVLLTDDASLAATVTWHPDRPGGVYLHIHGTDFKSFGQFLTPHTAMLLGNALLSKAQTAHVLRNLEDGNVTDRKD